LTIFFYKKFVKKNCGNYKIKKTTLNFSHLEFSFLSKLLKLVFLKIKNKKLELALVGSPSLKSVKKLGGFKFLVAVDLTEQTPLLGICWHKDQTVELVFW